MTILIKNGPNPRENEFISIEKIELRDYQTQIAGQCVKKNSLVVIPTGLGKTMIAVLVAGYKLREVPEGSKLIILAPTRPLIDQHYESFKNFLTIPEDKFAILTGRISPGKRAEVFEKSQVILFTPQTLRNDLVNKKYSLKDTCLIVFDEAHHASGDYPYTLIADEFLYHNPDGTILALTASPGATKKKITDLCKKLHVPLENIHLRSRKDDDVKAYLKPMDIYKIGVKMTILMEDIYSAITCILDERLHYLMSSGYLSKKKEPLHENVLRKDLVGLNSELLGIIRGDSDKSGAYAGISINAQALILFHMIELIEQQGLDILLEYLEKLGRDAKKKSSSKAVKKLAANNQLRQTYLELRKNQEYSPKSLIHPKFPVLENYILHELENAPDSRILIFVKLRNSVANIVEKFDNREEIRAVRFVGQATKSKKDKGLSQKKQKEILDEFKKGIHNVLVATNVAEEGLDIAECDLVIFYDVVASEIRLIQRKGRTARHRQGKVIILYCKDTRDEIYLRIAMIKLKKMNINLKNKGELRNFYETQRLIESKLTSGEKSIEDEANYIKDARDTKPERLSNSKLFPSPSKVSKPQSLDYFMNAPTGELRHKTTKEAPFSGIVLNKYLPMKMGLRKNLADNEYPIKIIEQLENIVILKKVVVQVRDPLSFNPIKILAQDTAFREKYELSINVFDFVDFQERYIDHARLYKKKISEFEKKNDVRVVCMDDYEELFFLIRSIFDNIIRKS